MSTPGGPSAARRPNRLRLSLCLIGVAGAAVLLLARGAPHTGRVRRARYLMGTILEIDAEGPRREEVEAGVAAAFAEVSAVENRLSNWKSDSELSRVNAAAGGEPVPLSAETFQSLRAALDLARETDGAFDPTVGGVTRALGLTGQAPDPVIARTARRTIGWNRVVLDASRRTITLAQVGDSIDSGAFGKGEALDRAVETLRRRGVAAARLNFGGQISVFGGDTRAGRRFQTVTVAAPDGEGRELCRFSLPEGSASTSGDSEKPGHLIDPSTGEAALFHGSVTVLSATGLRADALSTALFVMGPRRGLEFADRRGIAAIYVFPRGKSWGFSASRRFPATGVHARRSV
jgi:FAD:protein FMN transferase